MHSFRKYFLMQRKKSAAAQICRFSSRFEELMAIHYTNNIIRSGYLTVKPEEIIDLCKAILPPKTVSSVNNRIIGFAASAGIEIDPESVHYGLERIPKSVIIRYIRSEIQSILSKRIDRLSGGTISAIEKRLEKMKKAFHLTDEDLELVTFFYIAGTNEALRNAFFCPGAIEDFQNMKTFVSRGHLVLGMPRNRFLKAIAQKTLFDTMIMEESHLTDLELTPWCIRYLRDPGKQSLAHEFFSRSNRERLQVGDFDIGKDDVDIIRLMLGSGSRRNILFHGMPGTGKSSFARSIVKDMAMELLTVRIPHSGDIDDRIRAIYATVNLADGGNSVVLIDEADELLNSWRSVFFESETKKSWINNFLDSHNSKVIWITNRTGEIDPSTMRRFSHSVEFREFTANMRKKVLKTELRKRKHGGYFTPGELETLCEDFAVNADGIVKAVEVIGISPQTDKPAVMRLIRKVLASHEKTSGCGYRRKSGKQDFSGYDLQGLNTSERVDGVVAIVRNFLEAIAEGRSLPKKSIAILLYGRPGTGKTEFVNYLGHELGKEITARRSSDIVSKFVGETEQNIAGAFREAEDAQHILFFDEADSFLYPRAEAHHSYEKTQTNEILGQLDSFNGVVIFSTNDIAGLDSAALRRFRYKIEFRPLTAEGNIRFYENMLAPFIRGHISDVQRQKIMNLRNLTPGDCAVVRDRLVFDSGDRTHDDVIGMLEHEIRFKGDAPRNIVGFVPPS